MTIRVLLADDQEMLRTAFRMILNSQPDIEVVGEAADGIQAVKEARRLRPDVCLLDIRMPGRDGLEATGLLAGPDVPDPLNVVIATTFDLDEYVYSALRHGACGFLLKDAAPALLIEAVRAAAAGNALISPVITVRLLSHMTHRTVPNQGPGKGRRGTGPSTAPGRREEELTTRELDLVALVAHGHTNDELAARLHITLSTVKTHLANIQRKLATRNRVEIAAWAWQHNIPHTRRT